MPSEKTFMSSRQRPLLLLLAVVLLLGQAPTQASAQGRSVPRDDPRFGAVQSINSPEAAVQAGMEALGAHLAELGVELRDLEMGLVDFPGERDGERVWLCWRLADPAVAFWHTTLEGFANRRPW